MIPGLLDYDHYIFTFSGGKDSMATILYLLEKGIDPAKVELWHHDVDGGQETFMDWECTEAYCKAFAEHMKLPIYYSYKEGGFKREMLRKDSLTAPIWFQDGDFKLQKLGGERGNPSTRHRFPQVSADLKTRWCSAYLKIDVATMAIRNQERFQNKTTLVISGERGEESPARAKYAGFEPDRSDLRDGITYKRYVDRLRPILYWKEAEVWAIIERHRIRVHPAYYMGFNRVSCKFCIFGNADQFATAFKISPEIGVQITDYEKNFGCTIKRDTDIASLVAKGAPYTSLTPELTAIATSHEYNLPMNIDPWILPAGAYGEGCGPT